MGRDSDGKKRLRPELLSRRGLYPGEPEKRVWNFGGRSCAERGTSVMELGWEQRTGEAGRLQRA